jgi:hypothetical protein
MRKFYRFSVTLFLLLVTVGWSWAQYTVTGTVTDERTGEPLIGATVLVRNTTRGAVADLDGRFSIAIEGNQQAVLVISSLGYISKNVNVSPSTTSIEVSLAQDATNSGRSHHHRSCFQY